MKRALSEFLRTVCLAIVLYCTVYPFCSAAQSFSSRSYTTENGLPGNNLHCLLQDKRGFIWIGTEDGLARFDGAGFRQYHVTDGLPDNEIISLRLDKEGRVWALAFKGPPAIYNVVSDRFEPDAQTSAIAPGARNLDVLDGGGMALTGGGAADIFYNGSILHLIAGRERTQFVQITVALGDGRYLLISRDSARLFERGRQTGAAQSPLPSGAHATFVGNALYYCDSNGICKTALNSKGAIRQMCMARRTMSASRLSFTGKHLALISDNGTTAVLIDTLTLAEVVRLPLNGALARDMLEDGEGNIWIASIGQGLIRISPRAGISYNSFLPPGMLPCVLAVDGSVLLCGDDKGRIAVFRNGCLERLINISQWSKAVSRIRSIIVLKDGYYIAVEGDASLLLDKNYNIISLYNRPWLNYSDRCAALWHDSIILAGAHGMAVRLDYKACHGSDTAFIRATAIGADAQGRMIIGATDGLCRKDDTGLFYFGQQHTELRTRVADICTTPDGLVWAGTSNQLDILQGTQLAGTIHLGKEIPGTVCNTLCTGRSGEIWVGTDASLSRVIYSFIQGRLRWKAVSFGASEGIDGQVMDITWQRDTIYAATGSGVYSFPGQMVPLVRDIPVYITGIRINERDTILNGDWDLPYTASNWDILFSGVTLSGYLPSYQYRINSEPWQNIAEARLLLRRLAPGNYTILIRALKRDGSPSAQSAELHIKLRAPFWMSLPFWIVCFGLLLGLSFWLLQYFFRRKRIQQLKRIAMENELITAQQQTFSALMNPHFIFNALNSIQHYVLAQDKQASNRYLSGFGRLIRMNFEAAQKSYISLEEELERLQLYLGLEQMRFGDKLSYAIIVAEDVAPEDWQIPAMIIQPFVENALLHGIAPAKISGRLDVIITRDAQDLHISICDNGVGVAAGRQQRSTTAHTSSSMDLIARRVSVLRRLRNQDIRIEVGRNSLADELHPGTCVKLIFPMHFID